MKGKKAYGRTLFTLLSGAAIAAVLLLNLFTQVFSVVQYYGDGMAPSLQDRDILLVRKTDQVSRGDIVAFYYNNKVLVRRIVAESGSTLEMEDDGSVIVDGMPLPEEYVAEPAWGQCNVSFPYTVPYEEFFVMGDNRVVSMDSRLEEIGTVPRNRILGKLLFKLG